MLNLTANPITLIAESGETTTIPASGYVARVEYERTQVSCRGVVDSFCSRPPYEVRATSGGALCAECYACFKDDGDPERNGWNACVSLVEETPREIVCDHPPLREEADHDTETHTVAECVGHSDLFEISFEDELLLVTREVAEAAHALKHPLVSRMVWASGQISLAETKTLLKIHPFSPPPSLIDVPYRELQRSAHKPEAREERLDHHTQAVAQFLNDMYATLVDPVEDGPSNVQEMCALLLKSAQEMRMRLDAAPPIPTFDDLLNELRLRDPAFMAEHEAREERPALSLDDYFAARNVLYLHWVGRREANCNSFREAYNAGFEDGVKARLIIDALGERLRRSNDTR